MNPYIYTFIRDDLPFAQKIVQLGHATYEAGQLIEEPVSNTNLVLLHADHENDLLSIAEELDGKGIKFVIFFEPDLPGYTAICTCPMYTTHERSFFKRFSLYKDSTPCRS